MSVGSLIVALSLLAPAATAPLDQSTERVVGARAQTDQTITVPKGTRVELDDCVGEAVVRTWDRDTVRVQARHASRTQVRATLVGNQLRIDIDGNRGPGSADINLTVPAWINLRIDGHACFADVTGLSGAVSVKTVEGDIVLTGLTGTVDAESVEGKITLDGGRGRSQLSTVEGNIAVSKAAGEIIADSVDGDITFTDTQASAVEVSTVDGNISYSGTLQTSGRYLFATHDGDITLMIPESSSATFSVRGDSRVEPSIPLKQAGPSRRGQRVSYTLGGGAAQVDVETFDGIVRIRRLGDAAKD
jgi:DUF4097 and DUF4098 domain-containing protein YvlB